MVKDRLLRWLLKGADRQVTGEVARHYFKTQPGLRKTAPDSRHGEDLLHRPDWERRRAFFREHILVHTHIPKTAGSSLSAGLTAIVGALHTVDRRLAPSVPIEEMTPEDMDDVYFISSHTGYGLHRLFDRTPLYVAAVREPVDRAVSYYRYLQNRPTEPAHQQVIGKTFEDSWHALDAEMGPSRRNMQARMLISPVDDEPVDEALLWQRVEHDYFLLIPHDKVGHAIGQLQTAFGGYRAPLAKVNVSKADPVTPSDEIQRTIREVNALDAALYARVVAEYEDSLADACRYVAQRCLQRKEPGQDG